MSKGLDPRHVDVLDGVRAGAILLVAWFHIWQQSWLMPVFRLPFGSGLSLPGGLALPEYISFDCVPRAGFLFVDMLLLVSAFCLFLPHARAVFYGEPVPDVKTFYKKRLARIVPSYYFCVFVALLVSLLSGVYAGRPLWLVKDLLSTLTFTQTFFPAVLLGTALNGVLWTAAVEMQFYLVFPLLARCFRKKPLLTYLFMVCASMAYLQTFALTDPEALRYTLNQFPSFLGVFGNGMLAAYGYVWLTKWYRRRWQISLPATVLSLVCVALTVGMLKGASATAPVQVWQADHRYAQSLVFTLFLLSTALSAGWYRYLFSSRVARFLSGISYNLYIWHQWLAVKLKQWRIPYWSGEQPPNFTGDKVWQWRYTLLVCIGSLLVAALVTYLFERPVSRLILRDARAERKDGFPKHAV